MSNTIQNSVSSIPSDKSSEKNNNNNNNNDCKTSDASVKEYLLSKQDNQLHLTPKSSLLKKATPTDKNKINTNNNNNNTIITKKIEKKSSKSNTFIKGSGINQAKISSSKKRSKKNICFYPTCTKYVAKFIGDCNFCNGHFCSSHRLMESHNCRGLDTCKEQSHQRNADKLIKERTIVSKIQL